MSDLIQMMEPYLPSLSIGLTNQMLHLFGKSGKVEAMMKVQRTCSLSSIAKSFTEDQTINFFFFNQTMFHH